MRSGRGLHRRSLSICGHLARLLERFDAGEKTSNQHTGADGLHAPNKQVEKKQLSHPDDTAEGSNTRALCGLTRHVV